MIMHFSELTEEQIKKLIFRLQDEAIKFAKEYALSGLSHNGFHNVYTAIEDSITAEWENSKAVRDKAKIYAAIIEDD